jgi:hypothetical protein
MIQVLGQTRKCAGVKPVSGIPAISLINVNTDVSKLKQTCTDSFPLKRPHIITKMNDNINMDSTTMVGPFLVKDLDHSAYILTFLCSMV